MKSIEEEISFRQYRIDCLNKEIEELKDKQREIGCYIGKWCEFEIADYSDYYKYFGCVQDMNMNDKGEVWVNVSYLYSYHKSIMLISSVSKSCNGLFKLKYKDSLNVLNDDEVNRRKDEIIEFLNKD